MAHFNLVDDVNQHLVLYVLENLVIFLLTIRARKDILGVRSGYLWFISYFHLRYAKFANDLLAHFAFFGVYRHLIANHALHAIVNCAVHASL